MLRFNEDGENYIIHREINKNNKSEWTINGRPATHRAVSIKQRLSYFMKSLELHTCRKGILHDTQTIKKCLFRIPFSTFVLKSVAFYLKKNK